MIIRKRKTKKALWVELRKQPHLSDKSDEQIRKQAYRKEAAHFIKAARASNPYCPVVEAIPELYMSKSGRVIRVKVTQVHHKRGRNGTLLRDQRFWMAVSDRGHRWIHSHPDRSRARGWLCEKGQWNTEVPDGAGPNICLDTAASRVADILKQERSNQPKQKAP